MYTLLLTHHVASATMPGRDPIHGGVRALAPEEVAGRENGHRETDCSSETLATQSTSQKDVMWSALFGSSASTPSQQYASNISLIINGKSYKVENELAADTSLNTFIRDVAHLKGTKFMCNEGGCGACVVAATAEHPVSKQRETFSVNSCLVPVFACDGWEIKTVEGLGDRRTGYHRAQATLAHFNGTQCGYCSPGMVMNMYSLLEGNKAPTMADVENSFGGNLCRCTGYRPILDAFKSLSTDATPELKQACLDIEDVYKICSKTGSPCTGKCAGSSEKLPVRVKTSDSTSWHKPRNINELFVALNEIGDVSYKLVFGNTAEGVYRSAGITAYIDIKDVAELRTTSTTPVLTLGGNVTLTEAMRIFNESATLSGYAYLSQLAQHIDKIANVPVRNVGTIAGNLSIKWSHHEFPSDIFTTFEAVGATLNIRDAGGQVTNLSLTDYLDHNMTKKVILSVAFPVLSDKHRFRSFKITPRAQNAHAYVNAAFLVEFEDVSTWKVTGHPRVVYGGINPQFTHAKRLEAYLVGKNIHDVTTITQSMAELDQELVPDHLLPDARPNFRKKLAQALFYKSMWPVNQAVPKIEALAQCSGEAEFVNDMPSTPGELHGAMVLTTVSSGTIAKIDPAPALAMPGVVGFYSHTDLPGIRNNFTPSDFGFGEPEEVFCSGHVKYAGQLVGMIVAESRTQALTAARHVIVEYANSSRPMLTVGDVLSINAEDRIENEETTIKPVEKPSEKPSEESSEEDEPEVPPAPAHVIKGQFEIGKQYHLTMETQTCLIIPKEGGYDVFATTQWMDLVQAVVSRVLQIPASQVNVVVRRLGGGYGAKITRPQQLAAACAIAVKKLNQPVRLVLTMSENMELFGMRYGLRNKYEVGKIQYLQATIFQDSGWSYNDSPLGTCIEFFKNCYQSDHFTVNGRKIRTDTASNTWCRAPGTTEGVALIEEVMERIAGSLNLDPLAVRLANMRTDDNPLPDMIADLKNKANYDNRRREVNEFNSANRWKKRGMAIVPMQYRFHIWGNYEFFVAIHHIDGSVSVTHGGIEMGQGINTKVAQVVAHVLGVPLTTVTIHPSNSITGANSVVTGGSIGSEAVAYELMKRLEPVKAALPGTPSWIQIVSAAHNQNVDLCATHMFSKKDNVKNYSIWGATIAEVEVDILTGEKQNYKPPGAKDIPVDFRIYLQKNAPNPVGVLQSKATGEPPLNMSVVVLFAIRNAIDSARTDAGGSREYHITSPPATTEQIFMDSLTSTQQFTPS
ncbi:hypothetical protein B566_EDAN007357 [Ephemera danica]|nr:hypothetical protein B566_EDAN007357 [Ephemera danica]